MDISDQATAEEERQRAAAIAKASNQPARDLEPTICTGCSYATKAAWGRSCDGWRECLQDFQKREARQ